LQEHLLLENGRGLDHLLEMTTDAPDLVEGVERDVVEDLFCELRYREDGIASRFCDHAASDRSLNTRVCLDTPAL